MVSGAASVVQRGTPPSSNTGGKDSPDQVHVDWLSYTVALSDALDVGDLETITAGWMPQHPLLRLQPKGRGWLGFDSCAALVVPSEGEALEIGLIAWGGEAQKGRALVSLSGTGCAHVPPDAWGQVASDLATIDARLTRVDLAADDMAGVFSVDVAAQWYQAGEFTHGGSGRLPSCDQRGNWLVPDGRGRTLYVGKAKNGKLLRVYEKGKQLGDVDSPWVRWELQLGNKDRVIPYEVLTQRASYFAGGFECLGRVVEVAASKIKTARATVQKSLDALVIYASRSYGRLVHCLLHHLGGDVVSVVEHLRVRGVPASLRSAWAQREPMPGPLGRCVAL